MRTPKLYLGTMTFAWSQASSRVDEQVAKEMVNQFIAHQKQSSNNNNNQQDEDRALSTPQYYVDTARIYAGGKTELLLGEVLSGASSITGVLLGTKAHPSQPGGLSRQGIENQLLSSQQAMRMDTFYEYYLHQPDTEHSLLDSLIYLHELVSAGKIQHIGMSNYHASEMDRAFALCREHHLTPPTVYQGLYNPLNRMVEEQLIPILHKNQCSFVAYNPLAAGLLTGKHKQLDMVANGRFKNNPNYLPRFYTKSNFDAIQLIRTVCETEGISMVEATYRWLLLHSALNVEYGDGLLLGASSVKQLEENLAACATAQHKGPLSTEMLSAFDQAWGCTQSSGPFPYWRSYSSDMPNRLSLDPGASYETKK